MKLSVGILTLFVFGALKAATFDTYTNSISLGSQVTLKFKKVGTTKAKFYVEKSAAGFVAIGLGSSMSDADIVLIERDATTVTIKDCKVTGHATPACIETTVNWVLADTTTPANSYELTASSMKVEFTRDLAASGQDSDKAIVDGQNNIIYSYTTSNTVVQHDATGGKGTACIDLATLAACATGGSGGTTTSGGATGGSTTTTTTTAGGSTTSTSTSQTTNSNVGSSKWAGIVHSLSKLLLGVLLLYQA